MNVPLIFSTNRFQEKLLFIPFVQYGIKPTVIWCKSCIYPKKWFEITKSSNIGSAGDFNAILTALFMEGTEAWQQLWGGWEKNGQSWWPMNSMHRWCKPVPKIWELRCNSMQWRFFLYHLPCHLRLSFHRILRFVVFIVSSCHLRLSFSSDSIQTNPNLGPNPTSHSIDIGHLPVPPTSRSFHKTFCASVWWVSCSETSAKHCYNLTRRQRRLFMDHLLPAAASRWTK